MGKHLVFCLLLLGLACGQRGNNDAADSVHNDTDTVNIREMSPDQAPVISSSSNYEYSDFKDFYRNFFISLMEDNEVRFNTFINSERGVYIIDSKGAMPVFTNVRDISSYKRQDGRYIFSVDKSTLGFEMLEEELPMVDCDADGFYDKTGCFTESTNKLMETMLWQHAQLGKTEKNEVVSLAETVSKTVVNTANYVYYFSFIDGNWYLTFLDIRKPCEA